MPFLRRTALAALTLLALTASCGGNGTTTGTGGAATTTTTAPGGGGQGGTAGTGGATSSGGDTGTGGNTGTGANTGTGTGAAGGDTSSGTGGITSSGTGGDTSSGTGGNTGTGGTGTGTGTGGDGYGVLSMCALIGLPDILSPDPSLHEDTLDFTGYPVFDVSYLSPGGQAMYAAGNLNASSIYSEIFAYEVLYRCDGAAFLKGESQIVYAIDGKKTDLLVGIRGEKVGVSVVRAESFPKGSPYPVSQAFNVLDGKLSDILQSTANVSAEDAWDKQILAVIAQTPDHALAIEQAYGMVSAANKSDTIVVITVTEGDDDFLYYNQ